MNNIIPSGQRFFLLSMFILWILFTHSFKKYKGLFGFEFQKQITYNFDSKVTDVIIPLEVEDAVEYVPAPYYCVAGCGGNVTDPSDINVFDNGKCVSQDVCK